MASSIANWRRFFQMRNTQADVVPATAADGKKMYRSAVETKSPRPVKVAGGDPADGHAQKEGDYRGRQTDRT